MLITTWTGLLSQGAIIGPALLATVASYYLASLWADAFPNEQCRRCEQC